MSGVPATAVAVEQLHAGHYSIGSDVWPGLSKLVEESGELMQVVGKIMAAYPDVDHWDGTDLRERLHEELADLSAAIIFVRVHCGLAQDAIERRAAQKLALFERWHDAARHPSVAILGWPARVAYAEGQESGGLSHG